MVKPFGMHQLTYISSAFVSSEHPIRIFNYILERRVCQRNPRAPEGQVLVGEPNVSSPVTVWASKHDVIGSHRHTRALDDRLCTWVYSLSTAPIFGRSRNPVLRPPPS
jgi:hypothetical protein